MHPGIIGDKYDQIDIFMDASFIDCLFSYKCNKEGVYAFNFVLCSVHLHVDSCLFFKQARFNE